MKKCYGFAIAALALSLNGCYIAQNFDNQLQVSRTGQYQLDVDTDVVSGNLLHIQQESSKRKQPIPPSELVKLYASCEKEFNDTVQNDTKKGKHIVNSKYLGECKGHLTLKYTGNIIKEKSFKADVVTRDDGFFIPVEMNYNAKTKQIKVSGKTHGDRSAIKTFGNVKYNGKLSVKTDAKVVSNNADSKPYWGLIGSYKWNVVDLTTPDQSIVIGTSGI